MARTFRPIADAAEDNVVTMLALHSDKPCPTNGEICEWTGVPRNRLRLWLSGLQARGVIEIQRRGLPPAQSRRMRPAGGPWTDWTLRGMAGRRPRS